MDVNQNRMTRINKLVLILIGLIFVIQIAFVIFYFIDRRTSPVDPKDVFYSNINSIVELKCERADSSVSYGTAIVYDANGYLITNYHVVAIKRGDGAVEFDYYSVRFAFEENYRQAEIIAYDSELDLAILRIVAMPEYSLKPITFGSVESLKSGDKVYAIGNSLNQGISISQGIVGIPSLKVAYSDQMRTVIQSDIVITNGNSGGALLDENGLLIGITTFRLKDNNDVVVYGIAYSIPINIIEEFLSERG